jgi:hypothetical protein
VAIIDCVLFAKLLADVKRLGGGGFMTEFGAAANTSSLMEAMEWQLMTADLAFQSWTYWQFKCAKSRSNNARHLIFTAAICC